MSCLGYSLRSLVEFHPKEASFDKQESPRGQGKSGIYACFSETKPICSTSGFQDHPHDWSLEDWRNRARVSRMWAPWDRDFIFFTGILSTLGQWQASGKHLVFVEWMTQYSSSEHLMRCKLDKRTLWVYQSYITREIGGLGNDALILSPSGGHRTRAGQRTEQLVEMETWPYQVSSVFLS